MDGKKNEDVHEFFLWLLTQPLAIGVIDESFLQIQLGHTLFERIVDSYTQCLSQPQCDAKTVPSGCYLSLNFPLADFKAVSRPEEGLLTLLTHKLSASVAIKCRI
jgi:hypothetical protein